MLPRSLLFKVGLVTVGLDPMPVHRDVTVAGHSSSGWLEAKARLRLARLGRHGHGQPTRPVGAGASCHPSRADRGRRILQRRQARRRVLRPTASMGRVRRRGVVWSKSRRATPWVLESTHQPVWGTSESAYDPNLRVTPALR